MTILTTNKILVNIGEDTMTPRALTEQEKCRQCDKLLEKGKAIVLAQGIRKVSVDEITKAASMAKGSFYQHFESKEQFLYELMWNIHRQLFMQVEQMILSGSDMQGNMRSLLKNLFHMPEISFLIQNQRDIHDLFQVIPDQEVRSAKQMESGMFKKLLDMAGIDTKRVKPGVVHNYIHTLSLMKSSDLMTEEDLPETFDRIMDSLLSYIFGGAQ